MAISEHILHVDMDAFFVEVERRDRPELRGVPVVVGGLSQRGVVAAASYEARRQGVASAMPMAEARRRCPQARYLPPDHVKYHEASREVFEVLAGFTPSLEVLSVDEAFCDIGGLALHYSSAEEVAASVRRRLRTDTGLPSSAGAATCKLLAKLASEAAKPDGQQVIEAGRELDFLHPLPIRSLWGVGEATYAALEGLGVSTVGDFARTPLDTVTKRLGPVAGEALWDLAWARDDRAVETVGEPKSISVEQTYPLDVTEEAAFDSELFRHCDRLARRLRRSGYAARTVTLKVRYADFETITRSKTVEDAIGTGSVLYGVARALAEGVAVAGRRVRLLGIGASGLVANDSPRQLGFDGEEKRRLEQAADEARSRFGEEAVRSARLVEGSPPSPE